VVQWRSQEISEGMAVTVKKRSSTHIRDNIIPFYNVFAEKKWKKVHHGVAVAGSPSIGTATVVVECRMENL
jgi:hypothetical protein